jgi:hypothetical protein
VNEPNIIFKNSITDYELFWEEYITQAIVINADYPYDNIRFTNLDSVKNPKGFFSYNWWKTRDIDDGFFPITHEQLDAWLIDGIKPQRNL